MAMIKACHAYPVVRVLGSGTFGQVYLSTSPQGGKAVAVKVIKTSKSLFKPVDALKEVDLLRGLAHPNIVSFVDVLQRDSHFYIVMDYCDGGDLRDVLIQALEDRSPLKERRVGGIFVQILLALHYCHHSLPSKWTLVHRDLKPENVLLTQDGQVKLADFGLSTLLGGRHEQAYSIVGTPGYLAPEVMSCQPYGYKADMFSLGCILYEMLTLGLPDTQSLQKGHSIWSGTLTSISVEVRALASGLLSLKPEDRWSTSDVLSCGPVALWLNGRISADGAGIDEDAKAQPSLQELELTKRAKLLDRRYNELRTRSRQLGAREAELEAKIRKFTVRLSKSPSVEPEKPITRARKVAVKDEIKRKDAVH